MHEAWRVRRGEMEVSNGIKKRARASHSYLEKYDSRDDYIYIYIYICFDEAPYKAEETRSASEEKVRFFLTLIDDIALESINVASLREIFPIKSERSRRDERARAYVHTYTLRQATGLIFGIA